MAVPTILTHDDEGAPALDGTAGSLYRVFKWALPQLGWTHEFDDDESYQAAFRNDAAKGSGSWFKVWDDPDDHSAPDARYCRAQIYTSMQDLDNGTDPGYSSERYFLKSNDANGTERDWIIIGESLRFHFFSEAPGSGYYRWYHVGDLKPFHDEDPNPFWVPLQSDTSTSSNRAACGIIRTGSSSSSTSSSTATSTTTADALLRNFDNDGSSNSTLHSYTPSGGSNPDCVGGYTPGIVGFRLLTSRLIVGESTSRPRGEVVGAINLLRDRLHGAETREIDAHNGHDIVQCMYIPYQPHYTIATAPYLGSALIDIESDWDDW